MVFSASETAEAVLISGCLDQATLSPLAKFGDNSSFLPPPLLISLHPLKDPHSAHFIAAG
jgi:hypothetical protein